MNEPKGVIVCAHGKVEADKCGCGFNYAASIASVHRNEVLYSSSDHVDIITREMRHRLDTSDFTHGDLIDLYVRTISKPPDARKVFYFKTTFWGDLRSCRDGTKTWDSMIQRQIFGFFSNFTSFFEEDFLLFPVNKSNFHFGLIVVAYPSFIKTPEENRRACIIFMDPFSSKLLDVNIFYVPLYAFLFLSDLYSCFFRDPNMSLCYELCSRKPGYIRTRRIWERLPYFWTKANFLLSTVLATRQDLEVYPFKD